MVALCIAMVLQRALIKSVLWYNRDALGDHLSLDQRCLCPVFACVTVLLHIIGRE